MAMVQALRDIGSAASPELGYEEWRTVIRSIVGRYSAEDIDPNAFVGRASVRNLFGLCADLWDHNAHRMVRTQQDVRRDDVELYHAVFQVVGRSTVLQNDQAITLDVGEVALVDSTRPLTFLNEAYAQWLSLHFPRRSLISHLNFEPQGSDPGAYRKTRVGRLLFQLVLDEFREEPSCSQTSAYMQLAIYDLIGEMFSPRDSKTISPYTDKQFSRVCTIVRDGFADPALRPCDVAAQAGISLRYLQKLFAQRESTCSGFIDSLRLDHSAHLLQRRALANSRQPISEIAYASGFSDYNYFSKRFRRRFGHPPSAHAQNDPNAAFSQSKR